MFHLIQSTVSVYRCWSRGLQRGGGGAGPSSRRMIKFVKQLEADPRIDWDSDDLNSNFSLAWLTYTCLMLTHPNKEVNESKRYDKILLP